MKSEPRRWTSDAAERLSNRPSRPSSAAGAELVDVSVPLIEAAVATYYVLANSEASANLARFDGSRYGHRAAGARSLTEDVHRTAVARASAREVKRRIILGTFALSSGYYDAYYGRAAHIAEAMRQPVRQRLRSRPTSW